MFQFHRCFERVSHLRIRVGWRRGGALGTTVSADPRAVAKASLVGAGCVIVCVTDPTEEHGFTVSVFGTGLAKFEVEAWFS